MYVILCKERGNCYAFKIMKRTWEPKALRKLTIAIFYQFHMYVIVYFYISHVCERATLYMQGCYRMLLIEKEKRECFNAFTCVCVCCCWHEIRFSYPSEFNEMRDSTQEIPIPLSPNIPNKTMRNKSNKLLFGLMVFGAIPINKFIPYTTHL